MKKYLGVKLIEAEPMNYFAFASEKAVVETRQDAVDSEGYKVVYPDGYVSWSPKEVFESAYMPLGDPEGTKIVEDDVNNFISSKETTKIGEKTTLVHATLKNGFTITEASSCVDPANFDMIVGVEICLEKIKDKVWGLLGFLLQSGKNGFK